MMEKSEREVKGKKPYVSVCMEIMEIAGKDIVTASQDSLADNDITKEDIFD